MEVQLQANAKLAVSVKCCLFIYLFTELFPSFGFAQVVVGGENKIVGESQIDFEDENVTRVVDEPGGWRAFSWRAEVTGGHGFDL